MIRVGTSLIEAGPSKSQAVESRDAMLGGRIEVASDEITARQAAEIVSLNAAAACQQRNHDHAHPTKLRAPDGGHPHSLARRGYCMMFAISDTGVPSVAKWIYLH